MKKTLSIALLSLAFAGGGTWLLTQPAGPGDQLLPGAAQAQDAGEIDTSTIEEMVIGAEDAPVTLTEYASFTCPHCANFHVNHYPELKRDYIDTGKVQMVYREVYFDRFGLWASMIARCGGEERFFGLTSLIYEEQQDWTSGGDPAGIAENLRRLARTAGLDNDQLDACLSDATTAQTLVQWFEENAEADDITSTPTFLIDGEKFEGNWSSELFPALDAAVEASGWTEADAEVEMATEAEAEAEMEAAEADLEIDAETETEDAAQ
ncbi:thiol:disulfide interchange protein, DsbA family protein [Oceanicola granulosus HTCC2516]|uniref:Thiol:disulfide interchange protein, DsbA family protein n=1 Tax=Oceanicola granulosus (strain ATCC BAA-861 / DSM 15982 / KCTC 12143 / HTCC2516) TaxID=314256 RepID=Q2CCX6_OCEGH|nr:thiol:disulfide interchange protein, DsbA family protein [Oceanicola granulosus HTCC2516]